MSALAIGIGDRATASIKPKKDRTNLSVAGLSNASKEGTSSPALNIPGRGTSAHRQLQVYNAALDDGLQPAVALGRVVDALIDETAPESHPHEE